MKHHLAKQSGVMLLEALIGILIFSIGILAMVGLQSLSIKNQADAKYRADASYFANQILGQMWADRANVTNGNYQHHPTTTGPTSNCNFSGAASTLANVTTWTGKVAAALPGAASTKQQIIIDNTNPATPNKVTVVVCWKAPQETTWHNYLAITNIN